MFSCIQFIALFLSGFVLFVVSGYETINKSNPLNTKDCGVSIMTANVDNNCFEWHKEMISDVMTSRLPVDGEVPWMAFLVVSETAGNKLCGGALIATEWVLTAAHCVNRADQVQIFFGRVDSGKTPKPYMPEKVIVHEQYERFKDNKFLLDIALLKLQNPVELSKDMDAPFIETICLPEKGEPYFPDVEEYARIAGWGGFGENDFRTAYVKYRTNTKAKFEEGQIQNQLPFITKVDHQRICQGDEGSAVWQYQSGRAVLVGLTSEFPLRWITNTSGCQFEDIDKDPDIYTLITPVPRLMDWVMDKINNYKSDLVKN